MAIDLPGLIDTYGYWAIFVGAFLEGETILALGGLAAHRGYLSFWKVTLVALAAGFLGDQLYFFIGRFKGQALLARFPGAFRKAHRFDAMLARWHAPLIVAIRFMYGFRIAGPVLLGMGRVAAWKFVVCNLIGAAIWAPLIAGVGYVFGNMIAAVIDDMKRVELYAFAGLVLVGLVATLAHRMRARREDAAD